MPWICILIISLILGVKIDMDDFYTHESQGPALSDPISIELYSKEKLNVDIKAKLTSNITSRLPLN